MTATWNQNSNYSWNRICVANIVLKVLEGSAKYQNELPQIRFFFSTNTLSLSFHLLYFLKCTVLLRTKVSVNHPPFFWQQLCKLSEKFPNFEFFQVHGKNGELLCKSRYHVRIQENRDQKSPKLGHLSRSGEKIPVHSLQ